MNESLEKQLGDVLAQRVAELSDPMRLTNRKRRRKERLRGFSRRLRRRWGDALDALEELIATCAELGDEVARAKATDTRLFVALELPS